MMLRRLPPGILDRPRRALVAWWSPAHARLRLRHRALLISAPVLLLIVLTAAAVVNLVMVQRSTVEAFERHDVDALRADVEALKSFGVVGDGVTAFAEGDVLLLEGQLTDAESRFDEALQHTDIGASCPMRVNLELVRETLADLAVSSGVPDDAEKLYNSALAVVQQAPAGCFSDSADPSADRRAVLNDAQARLQRKLAAMRQPPPPPPTTATVTSEPPPPPGSTQTNTAPAPPPALPPIGPVDPNQPPPPGSPPLQLPQLPGENLPAPPPAPKPPPPPPPPPPGQPGPGELRVASPSDPSAPRILGPVGPDGLPVGDPNAAAPDLTLSPGDGAPMDRLQD
ncbi:MAG: hypothetical protein ACRDUB_00880, partial [Mycobacterium sp.]